MMNALLLAGTASFVGPPASGSPFLSYAFDNLPETDSTGNSTASSVGSPTISTIGGRTGVSFGAFIVSRIDIPRNDTLAGFFSGGLWTVEFWMRATGTPSTDNTFVQIRNTVSTGSFGNLVSVVQRANNTFEVRWSRSDNVNTTVTLPNIAIGVWHHLAFTRNVASNNVSAYIDGVRRINQGLTPSNAASNTLNATQPIRLGNTVGSNGASPVILSNFRFYPFLRFTAPTHDISDL